MASDFEVLMTYDNWFSPCYAPLPWIICMMLCAEAVIYNVQHLSLLFQKNKGYLVHSVTLVRYHTINCQRRSRKQMLFTEIQLPGLKECLIYVFVCFHYQFSLPLPKPTNCNTHTQPGPWRIQWMGGLWLHGTNKSSRQRIDSDALVYSQYKTSMSLYLTGYGTDTCIEMYLHQQKGNMKFLLVSSLEHLPAKINITRVCNAVRETVLHG
jgi:hypothetical protein